MSCYDIPSGGLRWRREFNPADGGVLIPYAVETMGEYACILGHYTEHIILRLADGADASDPPFTTEAAACSRGALDARRVYYTTQDAVAEEDADDTWSILHLLDLQTGRSRLVFPGGVLPLGAEARILDGYLLSPCALNPALKIHLRRCYACCPSAADLPGRVDGLAGRSLINGSNGN